ncbi:MAG TPA: hypothetical protein VMH49_07000 [Thermoplasmata archaeon]|nr:hypothetical protein [Thermoplasmata archaeon]
MAEPSDPVRATFVAILQQLNRAESIHEGLTQLQALELGDLQRTLRDFWALSERRIKLPFALGLLVRNGLVRLDAPPPPGAGRATVPVRYRITAQGKQFLVDALQKTDRIA